jgi:NAD-dependent dihydropyrimidine dehydrogenase PreA subunit
MRKLIYLQDIVSLKLNADKCCGCGMCLDVCPQGVFQMYTSRISIVDRDACMECGACSRNCPTGAVAVQAGVGCAAAVINGLLGRKSSECCCSVESEKSKQNGDSPDGRHGSKINCC